MDYNISQTDIKLDAGEAKIHLACTEAQYTRPPPGFVVETPPPPKKKKTRGRGPVWEFLDEEWKREQEKLQHVYVRQLEERILRRKEIGKTWGGYTDLFVLLANSSVSLFAKSREFHQ